MFCRLHGNTLCAGQISSALQTFLLTRKTEHILLPVFVRPWILETGKSLNVSLHQSVDTQSQKLGTWHAADGHCTLWDGGELHGAREKLHWRNTWANFCQAYDRSSFVLPCLFTGGNCCPCVLLRQSETSCGQADDKCQVILQVVSDRGRRVQFWSSMWASGINAAYTT